MPGVSRRITQGFYDVRGVGGEFFAWSGIIRSGVPDRTLPDEVVVPTTLPTPTELPPTLSELHRGTIYAAYAVSSRLSIGLSYWHERYRVNDFTLDIDANPDLVRGQALLIG